MKITKNFGSLASLALFCSMANMLIASCPATALNDASYFPTEEKTDTLGPCSVSISFAKDTLSYPPYFSLHATPSGTAPFIYKWTAFGGTDISNDGSSAIAIWQPDEYCVIVKDAIGCISVDCHPFNPDSLYCPVMIYQGEAISDYVTLAVWTHSSSLNSIQWSTGDTVSMIHASLPGSYEVTVTNTLGCTATTQFELGACNQLAAWVDMADSLDGIAAKVYLYRMGTVPPVLIDSALTDVATGIALFENLPTGEYTVSASLLPGSPWFPQYEPVTFAQSELNWQAAQTASIANLFCDQYQESPWLNIWLRKKAEFLFANTAYPNPVFDILSINTISQPFFYRLTDANGQILREEDLPAQLTDYQIPMQQYGNGIYFLQIRLDENWQVLRIVKM